MKLQVQINTTDYLVSCARIRNIKPTVLVRRLIDVIARDQMVSSVLDDEDQIRQRNKSDHKFRGAPLGYLAPDSDAA